MCVTVLKIQSNEFDFLMAVRKRFVGVGEVKLARPQKYGLAPERVDSALTKPAEDEE